MHGILPRQIRATAASAAHPSGSATPNPRSAAQPHTGMTEHSDSHREACWAALADELGGDVQAGCEAGVVPPDPREGVLARRRRRRHDGGPAGGRLRGGLGGRVGRVRRQLLVRRLEPACGSAAAAAAEIFSR